MSEGDEDVIPMDTDGPSNLDLAMQEAADMAMDELERTGRKRAAAVMLSPDEIAQLEITLNELKRRHTDALANRTRLDEKVGALRMFTSTYDIELNVAREFLPAQRTSHALLTSKILRAVREVINTWDGLWQIWFRRDFPEVVRDLAVPVVTEGVARSLFSLPDWLVHSEHRDDDHRYVNMPWRRYYAWWTFMRRSALREIAYLQEAYVKTFIREEQWKRADIAIWPLNIKAVAGVEWKRIPLDLAPFSYVHKGNYASYSLMDSNENVYLPERIFMHTGGAIRIDDAQKNMPEIAAARSPIFWLLRILAEMYRDTDRRNAWWAELKWQGRERLARPERSFVQLRMAPGDLNFDYGRMVKAFCSWYAISFRGADIIRRAAAHPRDQAPISSISPIPYPAAVADVTLADLPPAPMINGVWFVGQEVRPMCVGCHAPGNPTVRCKGCGSGYCGADCHGKNWHRHCAGCTEKK